MQMSLDFIQASNGYWYDVIDYRDMSVSDAVQDCVSKKISIISHEHPEWEHKKVIAVAYSYCRAKRDFYEKDAVDIINDFMVNDYPVQEYTKKDGTKVKAHERGDPYAGKLTKTIKGRKYIEYKPMSYEKGSGTGGNSPPPACPPERSSPS